MYGDVFAAASGCTPGIWKAEDSSVCDLSLHRADHFSPFGLQLDFMEGSLGKDFVR